MNWIAIAWAGFVATTMSAAFFWVLRSLGWSRFSPTVQLGCLFLRNPNSPTTETLGFVVLFLLGSSLLPALYLLLLVRVADLSWVWGAVLGALHGLAAAALLPAVGTISACVRAGEMPPPGHFGIQWGRVTPVGVVLGHAIYGAVVGAILAAF